MRTPAAPGPPHTAAAHLPQPRSRCSMGPVTTTAPITAATTVSKRAGSSSSSSTAAGSRRRRSHRRRPGRRRLEASRRRRRPLGRQRRRRRPARRASRRSSRGTAGRATTQLTTSRWGGACVCFQLRCSALVFLLARAALCSIALNLVCLPILPARPAGLRPAAGGLPAAVGGRLWRALLSAAGLPAAPTCSTGLPAAATSFWGGRLPRSPDQPLRPAAHRAAAARHRHAARLEGGSRPCGGRSSGRQCYCCRPPAAAAAAAAAAGVLARCVPRSAAAQRAGRVVGGGRACIRRRRPAHVLHPAAGAQA